MSERIHVSWVSQIGVGHEDVITGDRLVCSMPETTAAIRVYTAGKLAAVHTISNVSRMLWESGSEDTG